MTTTFDILALAKWCKLDTETTRDLEGILSRLSDSEEVSLKTFIDKTTSLAYETGCIQANQANQERDANSFAKSLRQEEERHKYRWW